MYIVILKSLIDDEMLRGENNNILTYQMHTAPTLCRVSGPRN